MLPRMLDDLSCQFWRVEIGLPSPQRSSARPVFPSNEMNLQGASFTACCTGDEDIVALPGSAQIIRLFVAKVEFPEIRFFVYNELSEFLGHP